MLEIIFIAVLVTQLTTLSLIKKPKKLKQKIRKVSIGGIVGSMEGGKVINSYSSGTIRIQGTPENVKVGGIVGSMSKGATVESSRSDTKIEFIVNSIDDILYNKPLKLWVIGGFFLFLFTSISISAYYIFIEVNSIFQFLALWIIIYMNYISTTAIILKFFSKIKDKTLIELLKLAVNKPIEVYRFISNYIRSN